MCRLRPQFTIGRLMLGVALLALFLGGALPMVLPLVLSVYSAWRYRRQAVQSAGRLLFKAVRPQMKAIETLGTVLLLGVFVSALGATLINSAVLDSIVPPTPVGSFEIVADFLARYGVLLCAWFACPYPFFRETYLEFREHGLVCGKDFWPWNRIDRWAWIDRGDTLRLQVPYRFVWYKMAEKDKEAIEAMLEASVGSVKHRVAEEKIGSRNPA